MKKILSTALVAATLFIVSCNGNKDSNSTSTTDSSGTSSDTSGSTMNSGNSTNGSSNSMRSDTAKTSMNAGSGKTVTDKDVTDFVKKAASGGMMEVQMGDMASSNATSQRVKDYGKMLVQDHTAAGNELKSMAMSNNIEVPTMLMPEHKANMDILMQKKGSAFDKAYMDMMVKDHKKDIEEYKRAAADLKDDSYKNFASKTLPVLQKHLDSAMAIQKSM